MTNDELNHFLNQIGLEEEGQQVIHTTAMTAVAALEELEKVWSTTLSSIKTTPKMKERNRWGETEEEYQKWKSKMAIESLAYARTPSSKLAMSYFWNRIDHSFKDEPQVIVFGVPEIARQFGLTDKGFRDLLPALINTGLFRRDQFRKWSFIGEPVMRRIDDAIEEHLTTV
jgi:hypothetical protein